MTISTFYEFNYVLNLVGTPKSLRIKFDRYITSDSLVSTIKSQGKEYFRTVATAVPYILQKILPAQISRTTCHCVILEPSSPVRSASAI